MEFPFGHSHHSHTHHHHHRGDDDDDEPPRPAYPPPGTTFSSFDNPPPPPPSFFHGADAFLPPPSQATQVSHASHVADDFNYSDFPAPPRHRPQADSFGYNYSSEASAPPPPAVHGYPPADSAASVVHVSHDVEPYESHASYRPHAPAFVHHQSHQVSSEFVSKPTVKVVTKADPNYSLTVRDGEVVLAPSDPSDEFQHWYKDEKYSTRVKDEEGFPCFSLVNKATGLALKHSSGESHPVQLVPYNPDALDTSALWSLSRDFGDGFRTIRMVNNIRLNVDAFHGDKRSGSVHDGTTIVLWGWNKGDNQLWKILPYCKFLYP